MQHLAKTKVMNLKMSAKTKQRLKARWREREASMSHPQTNYSSGLGTKSVNKVKLTVENCTNISFTPSIRFSNYPFQAQAAPMYKVQTKFKNKTPTIWIPENPGF